MYHLFHCRYPTKSSFSNGGAWDEHLMKQGSVIWVISVCGSWGRSLAALPTLFTGGPTNARCHCALCWRNHVAVAQCDGGPQCPQTCPGRDGAKSLSHSHRLRYTAVRPPVKERLLPPPPLPWGSSMWDGIRSECTDRDEPEVEWRRADAPHVEPAKLTEITKVASTGKDTAALGFNGGLRGQLIQQNEIRGASFVPHHSRVEKTIPSVWGKVRFNFVFELNALLWRWAWAKLPKTHIIFFYHVHLVEGGR